jgi:hypothetical protein
LSRLISTKYVKLTAIVKTQLTVGLDTFVVEGCLDEEDETGILKSKYKLDKLCLTYALSSYNSCSSARNYHSSSSNNYHSSAYHNPAICQP